jgi:hypothetical protein
MFGPYLDTVSAGRAFIELMINESDAISIALGYTHTMKQFTTIDKKD